MRAKSTRPTLADFVQFTNVVRRDTGNTDYIVLPLAAAVLAHLILAEPEPEPDSEDVADIVEERAAASRLLAGVAMGPAPPDFDVYRDATDLVLMSWDRFHWWVPFTFRFYELDAPPLPALLTSSAPEPGWTRTRQHPWWTRCSSRRSVWTTSRRRAMNVRCWLAPRGGSGFHWLTGSGPSTTRAGSESSGPFMRNG